MCTHAGARAVRECTHARTHTCTHQPSVRFSMYCEKPSDRSSKIMRTLVALPETNLNEIRTPLASPYVPITSLSAHGAARPGELGCGERAHEGACRGSHAENSAHSMLGNVKATSDSKSCRPFESPMMTTHASSPSLMQSYTGFLATRRPCGRKNRAIQLRTVTSATPQPQRPVCVSRRRIYARPYQRYAPGGGAVGCHPAKRGNHAREGQSGCGVCGRGAEAGYTELAEFPNAAG